MNGAIEDESVLAELRTIENVSQGWGIEYTLRIVDVVDHRVDVELRRAARAARIWIALPESDRPMPWLDPDDDAEADIWVEQLLHWLNDEMDTVGIGDAAARAQGPDGVARIIADGDGFRVADVPSISASARLWARSAGMFACPNWRGGARTSSPTRWISQVRAFGCGLLAPVPCVPKVSA